MDDLNRIADFEFDWDDGNGAKFEWIRETRHSDISMDEIESVFADKYLLVYPARVISFETRYSAVGFSNKKQDFIRYICIKKPKNKTNQCVENQRQKKK